MSEEKLVTGDVCSTLILAADRKGKTVWNGAALQGKIDVFQKVSDWAEGKLKTEEINNKFLLATDNKGGLLEKKKHNRRT